MNYNLPIKIDLPTHFLEEEEREGYVVSSNMKRVWAVEIDLLCEFIRVCEKYHLKWYLGGGSALGAIRHKGFIPWDDDIDIDMPRSDYDFFCKVAEKELKHPYFFSNGSNEKQVHRAHAQLRNSLTTAILAGHLEKKYPFNQGIFIDIFPQDNYPDDAKDAESFVARYHKLNRWIAYADCTPSKNNAGWIKLIMRFLRHWLCKSIRMVLSGLLTRLIKRNGKKLTSRTAMLAFTPLKPKLIFDKNIINSTNLAKFEWLMVQIPTYYNEYLTQLYGDWKEPVKGASIHGDVIFDAQKPYTEYLK